MKKILIAAMLLCTFVGIAQAQQKFSTLPSGAPLTGTDTTAFARSGTSVKGTVADLETYIRNNDNALKSVFKTSNNTCNADVTTALEAHMEANSGVAIMPPGCYLLNELNPNSNLFLLEQIPGTVTYKTDAGNHGIYYDPGAVDEANVWSDLQVVTAITDTQINRDDNLECLSVASTANYKEGDYVHIMDAASLPSQAVDAGLTIASINLGSTTTINTTGAHGQNNSRQIHFRNVGGTTQLNNKTWNITVVDSDSFTIESMDGTTTGSAVNSTAWGAFTSGGMLSTSGGWVGEANRVSNVDAVSNRICLTHKLQYRSLYTVRPELHRYTQARKMIVSGGLWTANGNTRDPSITTRDPMITVRGVVEPTVKNAVFDNTWGQAVEFRGTPAFIFENNRLRNGPNQATFDDDNGDGISESPEYTTSSATNASQGVFTMSASPTTLVDQDNVYVRSCAGGTWNTLNDKLYRVSDKSGSTFKLKDMNNNYVSTSGLGTYTANSCLISEADVQGLGYGVLSYGPSFAGLINNIDAFEWRHVITSGGAVNAWSTRDYFSGQSTYVTAMNINSHSAMGPVADLHEDNAAWLFKNINVFYAARGNRGSSYSGLGAQFRGKGTTIDGYFQQGGAYGIRLTPTEHEADDITTLRNIIIKDLRINNLDDSDTAIWSQDMSALPFKRYMDIDNLTLQNVGKGILAETGSRIKIGSINASNIDELFDNEDGTEMTADNVMVDYRNQTRTATTNGIALMRSSVTYGGAKLAISKLTLHRGTTSSIPNIVFREQDTTATKLYWLGDLVDNNYSSVSTTFAPVSTSATTMMPWTVFNKSSWSTPKEVTASTYTTTSTDSGKTIRFNRSSTQTVTLSKTARPGFFSKWVRVGTGRVTWVAESGATVNAPAGIDSINAQYGQAFIEVTANADGVSAVYNITVVPQVREFCQALGDQTTPQAAGVGKATLYLPRAAELVYVRAYAATAPTGTMTLDLNEGGTTVLSTNLTLDANEKTGGSAYAQGTAATAAVISDTAIAANAELTWDIDSTTGGAGVVGCVGVNY